MESESNLEMQVENEGVSKRNTYILVALGVVLVGALIYGLAYRQGLPNLTKEGDVEQDWVAELQENTQYVDAQKASKAGKFAEAVATLERLKSETTSVDQRSILDMDIAGNTFQQDRTQGALRYAQIAGTNEYPKVTRGTAFLTMYLQYAGTGNKDFIKPFYTPEEFAQYSEEKTLPHHTALRMYQLFPFAIAGVVLARQELYEYDPYFPSSNEKPSEALNTEAERIYETYLGLFDSSIAFLERGEGMRQFVPNTYLAKAGFLGDLSVNGYAFKKIDLLGETVATYNLALERARAQSAAITEQFILARYTNYLLAMNKKEEAEVLIKTLVATPITPMFKEYVQTPKAAFEIPALLAYAETNQSLKSYFAK
jgi:hypothetical protein